MHDAPGLVLGRIVCQVVNEAAFTLGEGLGSAEDIDAGMVHGLNYPRGILAWADEIGLDHVLAMLDALALERGEERYRVAPILRRLGLVRAARAPDQRGLLQLRRLSPPGRAAGAARAAPETVREFAPVVKGMRKFCLPRSLFGSRQRRETDRRGDWRTVWTFVRCPFWT